MKAQARDPFRWDKARYYGTFTGACHDGQRSQTGRIPSRGTKAASTDSAEGLAGGRQSSAVTGQVHESAHRTVL